MQSPVCSLAWIHLLPTCQHNTAHWQNSLLPGATLFVSLVPGEGLESACRRALGIPALSTCSGQFHAAAGQRPRGEPHDQEGKRAFMLTTIFAQ